MDLNTIFDLRIALDETNEKALVAKGSILALEDFNNEQKLIACEYKGCEYVF